MERVEGWNLNKITQLDARNGTNKKMDDSASGNGKRVRKDGVFML